jgi:NAD(P)-dependent dehydrogenase (short-subunit alcohol dehydrogenase family)
MQEALLAGLASQAPLERVGNPDETAAVALFLASDDSSYSSFMTGSEVFVDGGLAQV